MDGMDNMPWRTGKGEGEMEMEMGDEDGDDWGSMFGDELGDDVAAAMLEEMGFDVVSPPLLDGDVSDGGGGGGNVRNDDAPPRIQWAETTASWLWDAPNLTRVENGEGWPLIHLPGMLSPTTMDQVVLPLCTELEKTSEKVEQVSGSVG